MTKSTLLLFFVSSFVIVSSQSIQRIAFGSCANQNKEQVILYKVLEHNPELFIYLGDNIYGDTHDMDVLRTKYAKLGAQESFKALKRDCDVLAIWDDHDYGQNDGGKGIPNEGSF